VTVARYFDHRCVIGASALYRFAIPLALGALLVALTGCVTLKIPRTGEMVARLSESDFYRGAYRPARGVNSGSFTAVPRASATMPGWSGQDVILADLIGPQGRIRCRFELIRPAIGVLGGGWGQCLLPDGSAVASSFPAQL